MIQEFFNDGSRTGPSSLQDTPESCRRASAAEVKAEDTLNLEALLGDKNFDETEAAHVAALAACATNMRSFDPAD